MPDTALPELPARGEQPTAAQPAPLGALALAVAGYAVLALPRPGGAGRAG